MGQKMTDTTNLPPLPAPAYSGPDGTGNFFNLYTAAQVEEIRRAAILQERERCATICRLIEERAWDEYRQSASPHYEGKSDGAGECWSAIMRDCAAAIREGDK